MAGRPREDSLEVRQIIINLAKNGMTNTDIARITGFSRVTIQAWLKDTDLGEAVKETRKAAIVLDMKQKQALNKMALSAAKRLLRKRKTTETSETYDENGKLITTVEKKKEIEPNAGMVQFILKNTDPASWKDNPTEEEPTDETEDNELTINIVEGANGDA